MIRIFTHVGIISINVEGSSWDQDEREPANVKHLEGCILSIPWVSVRGQAAVCAACICPPGSCFSLSINIHTRLQGDSQCVVKVGPRISTPINYLAAQTVYLSTLKDSIVDSAPLLAPTNINYTEDFDLLPQTRQ